MKPSFPNHKFHRPLANADEIHTIVQSRNIDGLVAGNVACHHGLPEHVADAECAGIALAFKV